MASFSIALSGLTAASSDLDITANNVANADTVGFKESRAEFADVFVAGAVNLNTSAIGEGVRLASTAQQFTQGNISTSSSNWISRSAAMASSPCRTRAAAPSIPATANSPRTKTAMW